MNPESALLSTHGLTKIFRQTQGLFSRQTHVVRALDDVSLTVPRGATLGIVGESGSGKSTLGRCLLRLVEPDAGRVVWHERDGREINVTALGRDALRQFRPRMQVIFQDPFNSLNPARPVWQIVGEGLFVGGRTATDEIRERATAMLDAVGLRREHLDRLPHEFSGGQRQRIAIARALIVEPEFLVCDEVTSALDTRTQAQILELLRALQTRTGVTLLFISHDLHTVAAICREIIVMQAGRIVEHGSPATLFAHPAHHYTRQLLAAVPSTNPRRRSFRPPRKMSGTT